MRTKPTRNDSKYRMSRGTRKTYFSTTKNVEPNLYGSQKKKQTVCRSERQKTKS